MKERTAFATKLFGFLQKGEMILLMTLIIGLALRYTFQQAEMLVIISLAGLAMIFFLSAYQPIPIQSEKDEKFGPTYLLYYIIAPKILGISSAVCTVGLLFYFIDHNNPGFRPMLTIGAMSIAAASLIVFIGWLQKDKNIQLIIPILYRAIPLMIVSFYFLSIK